MANSTSTRSQKRGEVPELRGVSVVGPIDAARGAVTVEELAERLSGPGVRRGKEVFFRCPLHNDTNPSLRVDPAKNVWYCDPCGVGGDVVELYRLAHGHDRAAEAAAYLLMELGHEVPQRPQSWFARQERQKPLRDRMEAEKIEHVRRLVFRIVWVPWLKTLPEWGRDEAIQSAWETSGWMADRLYASRRSA